MSLRSGRDRANPTCPPTDENLLGPTDERRQFAHEHSKAYDAVQAAANLLEMAGEAHEREAGLLRAIRRRLASHLVDGGCDGG